MSATRYRLRRALELFFADDGNAYLLRGGAGQEHVIRAPTDEDRELLRRLAAGPVAIEATGHDAKRVMPLVRAGAVVEAADVGALAHDDAERFDRQLPYFEDFGDPVDGQLALRAASVGVIGCGGLGSWALGALASVGVGRFVLVDHDTVELSNLNRQILYGVGDIGAGKADRAAAWLRQFDPHVDVTAMTARIDGPDDLDALADCDVWLLTADWPPYELARWVNDASLRLGIPYLLSGQQPPLITVGPTYLPGRGACVACQETAARGRFALYDEIAEQRQRRPVTTMTLGPASALIGSLLSLEVLHLIVGDRPTATHDRILTVDIRTLRTSWIDVERDPDCHACAG